jgi:hypothetical protein
MTRKHFQLIADSLQLVRPAKPAEGEESAEYGQWLLTVATLARQLSGTNPRFDADRFLAACDA